MKAQVREIAVLASAMLLGACTSTSASIPTSVVTTTTTTMTTTTTTVPTTTTSMAATTTTVVEVDGVPADLLALIGSPMPEVDLTIESEEDVERWLEELFRWNAWLGANPTSDLSVLGLVLADSYLTKYAESKARLIEDGVIKLGGYLDVKSVDANMENFDIGIISLEVESRRSIPYWTLDANSLDVIGVLEADDVDVSVFSDVILQEHQDGNWRLVAWQRR